MDQADIPALLARLNSDEDAGRRMAVFKLQSSINDPAFADVFISSGGLDILRHLIMTLGGNTLAYALQSLSRLLEVDMGWDIFNGPHASDLIERIVELIVMNPLVNILRGAMSILVALVGHSRPNTSSYSEITFGFRALKPAVAVHPQFFELVVQQLQSADHMLCANSLQLINALIRDSIMVDGNDSAVPLEDWLKFIRRLQDLGLFKSVFNLMQSSALQDLAHPLLEFQSLVKVLSRKWRQITVDQERPEHRRALKSIHLSSAPGRYQSISNSSKDESVDDRQDKERGRKHNPSKWRRLGFETENPAPEFEFCGYLGLMDLADYVKKNEDGFQKLLLEQSSRPLHERIPVARASMAVSIILYDHFEVDKDLDEPKSHQSLDANKMDEKLFKPLILQWSRMHTAGLHAFFRLWKATGAVRADFDKVAELVRILIEQVIGQATRTKTVVEVEEELQEFECTRLRALQMELLELSFEDNWGQHLYQVREELRNEALQFVKEQRIRCLLQGAWFTRPTPKRDYPRSNTANSTSQSAQSAQNGSMGNGSNSEVDGLGGGVRKRPLYTATPWRFARLSHNRRFLHYADFAERTPHDPTLDDLSQKIDLSTISSVVSNVSSTSNADGTEDHGEMGSVTPTPANKNSTSHGSSSSASLLQNGVASNTNNKAHKITINSFDGPDGDRHPDEKAVLVLYPLHQSAASEWLDGLLLLLHQTPITAETDKLVNMVSDYGLKIRLLNVNLETSYSRPAPGMGVVPSREGLNEDYYFEV
ncbi:hypothetical protein CFIMG_007433RA00001 [Ceratocystis fimbriata CBS 114723]|uniref:ELMO domain-containing protein n=1 Tax=Ceratocystis fimbriata CBS 114723 TaxID=1035309 RepID=A0A2C5WVX6_9PEZI|nr:hypothetical protein CFIMG_007433RA00001 [Ceratocystis fimbriata CBS 114723]